MARSTYVYLVMWSGVPFGAFTVKHELRSWLGRQLTAGSYRLDGLIVFRMPDGGGEGAEMSIPDILAGK